MHDIICPNCGEIFLGYDVAFDMSDYVLPLLYSDSTMEEAVRQVKFKYYVDEESIINSNPKGNMELLHCTNPGGPNPTDQSFTFHLSGKVLYDYVFSKSYFATQQEFDAVLSQIKPAVKNKDYSKITPLMLSRISSLYHTLFAVSDKLVGDISIDDEYVRTAIQILVYIFDNKANQANVIDYSVCIYSSNMNNIKGYHVPDILFVRVGAMYKKIAKCCRFCGKVLPSEFGYYKMKPVVLLGSHSSGKTSYILGLLDTVLSKPPFLTSDKVKTATLLQDFNLKAFMDNIARFRNGIGAKKTDFEDVPILNLKVSDTIYSFIDWPGEKFITGTGATTIASSGIGSADEDYLYKSRRVITRARHVLFFMPPEQIVTNIKSSEEDVTFNVMDLSAALAWHLAFPEKKRFASLTIVANKADKLKESRNYANLSNQIEAKQEIHVYDGQNWNEAEFNAINSACVEFMSLEHPSLYGALSGISAGSNTYERYYLAVAPYGYTAASDMPDDNAEVKPNRGMLCGLPFLRILKTDGII